MGLMDYCIFKLEMATREKIDSEGSSDDIKVSTMLLRASIWLL